MKTIGLLILAFSPCVMADEPCRAIDAYTVTTPVTFHKVDLKDAVEKLVVSTPFRVISEDTTGIMLTGKNVSGPLGSLLTKMGNSARFSYKQDGCVLTVTPVDKDGKLIQPVWSVNKGQSLADELARWSKIANWTLSYEVEGQIILGADLSFDGDFEGAVDLLLDTIKKSTGVNVDHHFFYKNKMLRVYREALVHAAQPK